MDASNLSELLVTLGRLEDDAAKGEAGAVATGAQSVDYADRSGDAFQRMSKRTTHADALLQAGAWAEAARRFAEAEAMQRERQPDLPLLYSLRGYRWCDLKLAQGRAGEVAVRANSALAMSCAAAREISARHRPEHCRWPRRASGGVHGDEQPPPTFRASLGGERVGAARPQAAAAPPSRSPTARGVLASAAPQLDAAVDGLRAAGSSDHLPRGLLARAAYHRDAGNDKLASEDLTEAFEIAERGGMRLFLADCWLESARQRLAGPNRARNGCGRAAEAVVRAEKIVEETGYHRRDPDLAIVRAELALMLGDVAAARSNLDAVIAAMRAHDLWSFLPEVVRLAERHGLADLAPTIADLTAQRARFDAEADAAFEEARKVRRADGLDDDVIDARLADPRSDGQRPSSGATRAAPSGLQVDHCAARLERRHRPGAAPESRSASTSCETVERKRIRSRRSERRARPKGTPIPPRSPTPSSRKRSATPTSAGCWTRCWSNPARPSSPTSTPTISARPRAR